MKKRYKGLLLRTSILFCFGISIFSSCTKSSPWESSSIFSQFTEHQSTRLLYKSADILQGLDLEIIETATARFAYIILPEPCVSTDKESPLITIQGEKSLCSSSGKVLEGGYKIKLPEDLTTFLTEELKGNGPLTISFDQYLEIIEKTR